MKIVVDSDVVLSGLMSANGASRIILMGVRAAAITPLVNVAIMLEYEAVLKRPRNLASTGLTATEVDQFLDAWATFAEPVPRGFSHRPLINDPDDEAFVEAAINGQAEALVTFNVADYRLADKHGMEIGIDVCRPGEFLRRLAWRPATTRFASRQP